MASSEPKDGLSEARARKASAEAEIARLDLRTSMDPELHDAPPSPAPRDPDTLDMFEAPVPAAQDDSSGDAARVLGGTV